MGLKKFRLLGGRHWDKKGREFKKGDIITSDRDLIKSYPNKFELVMEIPESSEEAQSPKINTNTVPATESAKTPIAPHPLGSDVTDRFPTASQVGMKVFRKGKDYMVVDAEENKTPLNEQPLNKEGVGLFLEQHTR